MKRQHPSTQDKPVLDEGAFHQLLAAAYALQQHNDRLLVKYSKADCAQILSDQAIAQNVRSIQVAPLPPATVAHPVVPLESQGNPVRLARLAHCYRAVRKLSSLTDELFWKAATVVTVAGVSALLLGATIYRLSPLPGKLALPSEAAQKQVPFHRTKRLVTVPASPQKPIAKPNRPPSSHDSEADVVAEDTVVRYGARSAAPRLQAGKKP
jgi:hypothetical protein